MSQAEGFGSGVKGFGVILGSGFKGFKGFRVSGLGLAG